MAELVGNNSEKWIDLSQGTTSNIAKQHEQEMYRILDDELARYNVIWSLPL